VFASPEPITLRRLVDLLERPDPKRVEAALVVVAERLAGAAPIAPHRRRSSDPHDARDGRHDQRLFKARKAERISGGAGDALRHRLPPAVTRRDPRRAGRPDARTLVERGLARVTGRATCPDIRCSTATRDFLDRFGLGSLEELPRDTELSKD
jgi:hypothetical protein